MDDPAVIHAEESMFVKMNLFENRIIDGHAPYLPNKELSAYKMAGVDTDHEATTFEYAWRRCAGDCMYTSVKEVRHII